MQLVQVNWSRMSHYAGEIVFAEEMGLGDALDHACTALFDLVGRNVGGGEIVAAIGDSMNVRFDKEQGRAIMRDVRFLMTGHTYLNGDVWKIELPSGVVAKITRLSACSERGE